MRVTVIPEDDALTPVQFSFNAKWQLKQVAAVAEAFRKKQGLALPVVLLRITTRRPVDLNATVNEALCEGEHLLAVVPSIPGAAPARAAAATKKKKKTKAEAVAPPPPPETRPPADVPAAHDETPAAPTAAAEAAPTAAAEAAPTAAAEAAPTASAARGRVVIEAQGHSSTEVQVEAREVAEARGREAAEARARRRRPAPAPAAAPAPGPAAAAAPAPSARALADEGVRRFARKDYAGAVASLGARAGAAGGAARVPREPRRATPSSGAGPTSSPTAARSSPRARPAAARRGRASSSACSGGRRAASSATGARDGEAALRLSYGESEAAARLLERVAAADPAACVCACGATFGSHALLFRHALERRHDVFVCDECGDTFRTATGHGADDFFGAFAGGPLDGFPGGFAPGFDDRFPPGFDDEPPEGAFDPFDADAWRGGGDGDLRCPRDAALEKHQADTGHRAADGAAPASPAALRRLKDDHVKATERRARPGETCSICMEPLHAKVEVQALPNCVHLFHPKCAARWFKRAAACPVCRATVEPPAPEPEPKRVYPRAPDMPPLRLYPEPAEPSDRDLIDAQDAAFDTALAADRDAAAKRRRTTRERRRNGGGGRRGSAAAAPPPTKDEPASAASSSSGDDLGKGDGP
ncbi:ubiquitin-protein transferase [Aureococcus anophagefferens]|nr:ubiquitin-protein transferase [Aureococcus anophagefferens]